MGVRGLVIDPYNYIEMPGSDKTETNAISDILTKVKKFCMAHDVHTWFVAHPSKINRSGVEQPRPDGMSISGSMAWWAKTDCGLTIHRKDNYTELAVWKCRYRWVGTQGETNPDLQQDGRDILRESGYVLKEREASSLPFISAHKTRR
jgi:twinkle protein